MQSMINKTRANEKRLETKRKQDEQSITFTETVTTALAEKRNFFVVAKPKPSFANRDQWLKAILPLDKHLRVHRRWVFPAMMRSAKLGPLGPLVRPGPGHQRHALFWRRATVFFHNNARDHVYRAALRACLNPQREEFNLLPDDPRHHAVDHFQLAHGCS